MMKHILSALAFATLVASNPVPATSTAPPSFKIASVVYGGTGCPQGSIDVDFTNSGLLPIYFGKDFTASVGPDVDVTQQRKNCQLNLDLQFSAGYQYAVYSADYAGWANIDSGVKGYAKATYYFSGQTAQASSGLALTGPYSGQYTRHDSVPISAWSPCGSEALLNVNAEVALTPVDTSASGTLIASTQDGRFTHSLYLQWRQC